MYEEQGNVCGPGCSCQGYKRLSLTVEKMMSKDDNELGDETYSRDGAYYSNRLEEK